MRVCGKKKGLVIPIIKSFNKPKNKQALAVSQSRRPVDSFFSGAFIG